MNDKTQERAAVIAALRCKPQDGTECDTCRYAGTVDGCDTGRIMMDAADLLERDVPNDPLTLEELRGMGGEPYYHVSLQGSGDHWEVMDTLIARNIQDYHYGERWLAYRRKPEGSTK